MTTDNNDQYLVITFSNGSSITLPCGSCCDEILQALLRLQNKIVGPTVRHTKSAELLYMDNRYPSLWIINAFLRENRGISMNDLVCVLAPLCEALGLQIHVSAEVATLEAEQIDPILDYMFQQFRLHHPELCKFYATDPTC